MNDHISIEQDVLSGTLGVVTSNNADGTYGVLWHNSITTNVNPAWVICHPHSTAASDVTSINFSSGSSASITAVVAARLWDYSRRYGFFLQWSIWFDALQWVLSTTKDFA